MPATSSFLKELHVAKSIEELDKLYKVDLDNHAAARLLNSASKVLQAADTFYLDKDEETAYVQYMKFIEIILLLKKKSDFTHKNSSFNCLLESVNTALVRAESLKQSLIKRYAILKEATSCKQNGKNEINFTSLPKNQKETLKSSITETLVQNEKQNEQVSIEHSISCEKLYSLLTSTNSFIIMMDSREQKEYEESHIKHSNCISIPQEILKPGTTAAKLESQLPASSLSLWYKRSNADYVVLIDWESKDENIHSIHINALIQAMCKWDQSCTLKHSPLILRDGYKDWMLKYPMFTTRPLNFSFITDNKAKPLDADVSTIVYPHLDENSLHKENASINEKNKQLSNALFKKSVYSNDIMNGFSSYSEQSNNRFSKSAPTVDRKSKPNIDRGLKSGIERKTNIENLSDTLLQEGKNIANLNGNKIMLNTNQISKPETSNIEDKNKSSLAMALNKEESLAKENLEITKQRLNKEEEFDKLRLRKELEAEESKRIEIQKQEDILIERLKQLEIQSQEKDAAYLKIKEENMKMKKLLQEHKDKEYQKVREKEILEAELKKKNLQEQVERLREERKRKEQTFAKKPEQPREIVSANSALKRNYSQQEPELPKHSNATEYSITLSSDGPSRGMVRSHSSPNIAQMVNQEEIQPKIPDRNLKPKAIPSYQLSELKRTRIRNLNPVYGNCPVRPATGIKNLGNTCFMNSIIQCLSNTIPLAEYFSNDQYLKDINRENKHGTGGELAEEFAVIIRALWMGQYKSISPKDFKNTVSKCLSVCIGNEQQDSHEFLVVLMEKLHADFNKKPENQPLPNLDLIPDENVRTDVFWRHHKSMNSSIISEVFEGLLKSTLTCLSCHKTSNSYEVFSCLSLPILTSRCSLKNCLQLFFKPEKMSGEASWDCPKCKQKKEAEKRLHMCRLPDILIIQLKRFSYEGLWRRKLQTHVDFEQTFEMPYNVNNEEGYRSYNLYGIVNHYGTLEGGHYTAYCKRHSKWYKYDDHEVSEISSSDIKTSAAYLLFYTAVEFKSNL